MLACQGYFRPFIVVFCVLAGCSAQKQGAGADSFPGGSAGKQSLPGLLGDSGNSSGGTSGEPATSAGEAGAAAGGHDDHPEAGANGADAGAGGADAGASGADAGAGGADAGAAGAAGAVPEPPPAVCELDGGSCVVNSNSNSTCASPSASCSVIDLGFSCEFSEFKNYSEVAACGATATLGMACCGGCGCVKVEVYFDGKYCWQGIPDCQLDEYSGKLFNPRLP